MAGDFSPIPMDRERKVEISGELKNSMLQAATYEQLFACWAELKIYLDASHSDGVKQWGSVIQNLDVVYRCFQPNGRYACDTPVKAIFDTEEKLQELEMLGIPQEFLLQTVRVGAIKSMLLGVESAPHESLKLYSDGTFARETTAKIEADKLEDPEKERQRLIELLEDSLRNVNIDGFTWANEKLRELALQKQEATKAAKFAEEERVKREKESVIENIQARMHEPNFCLESPDSKLLKRDFQDKLIAWKGFFESSAGRKMNTFFQEHRETEFTSEFFAEFVQACEAVPEVRKAYFGGSAHHPLPIEIINPDSGWFAVLIINKQKTFGQFLGSACSNMNSWFVL